MENVIENIKKYLEGQEAKASLCVHFINKCVLEDKKEESYKWRFCKEEVDSSIRTLGLILAGKQVFESINPLSNSQISNK